MSVCVCVCLCVCVWVLVWVWVFVFVFMCVFVWVGVFVWCLRARILTQTHDSPEGTRMVFYVRADTPNPLARNYANEDVELMLTGPVMPSSCDSMNSWVYVVKAYASSASVHEYIVKNPFGDTCHGMST